MEINFVANMYEQSIDSKIVSQIYAALKVQVQHIQKG